MSISTIRRAFAETLGSNGACLRARMVAVDGGKQQRLEFDIQRNSGQTVTIDETVPARTDLVSKAREMATTFISEQ